jgi:hypothetical protein
MQEGVTNSSVSRACENKHLNFKENAISKPKLIRKKKKKKKMKKKKLRVNLEETRAGVPLIDSQIHIVTISTLYRKVL